MERKTSRRAGRLRALAVVAALGTSLLAGAVPANAAPPEGHTPPGLEAKEDGEHPSQGFETEGWVWLRGWVWL